MAGNRSFVLAAKSQQEDVEKQYPPVNFDFSSPSEVEGEEPETRTIVAHYPGDGPLTLMLASVGVDAEEQDAGSAIFALLAQAFNDDDYRYLRGLVRRNLISLEDLMQILEDCVEGWTSFPTKQPADYLPSQRKTGTRSTGRVRGPGSKS